MFASAHRIAAIAFACALAAVVAPRPARADTSVATPSVAKCVACEGLARALDAYRLLLRSIEQGIATRTARLNELATKALDHPPLTREDRDEVKRLDDELRQLNQAKDAWQRTVDEAQRSLDECNQGCKAGDSPPQVGSRTAPLAPLGSAFSRRRGLEDARAACPACEGLAQVVRMLEQAAGDLEDAETAARAELAALTRQTAATGAGQTREQYAAVQAMRKRVEQLENAQDDIEFAAEMRRIALRDCNGRVCRVAHEDVGPMLYGQLLTGQGPYTAEEESHRLAENRGRALCRECTPAEKAANQASEREYAAEDRSRELQRQLWEKTGQRYYPRERRERALKDLEEARIRLSGAQRAAKVSELEAQIKQAEAEIERLDAEISPLRREYLAIRSQLRELRKASEDAREALARCNRERCRTAVQVDKVVGITGTNPFNPDNPTGTGAGAQPQGPGSLQFSAPTYSGGEGGAVLVVVTRAGGSRGAVSVQFSTGAGTAAPGADFQSANGTLAWADGDTAPKSFSIALVDDTVQEGTETFPVTLSGATGGATIGAPAIANVSIADNDSPTPPVQTGSLQFSAPSYATAEGQGSVTLTVTRVGGAAGQVSVQFFTGPGSAQAGSDYQQANGTLAWGDGDTSARTFTVAIVDDAAVEGPETFFVTLNSPTGGATLGAPATATVTIADNDASTGACGPGGNAWTVNAGTYVCSGSCDPCPSPQRLSVNDNRVTVTPFHAGGAATFTGCNSPLASDSNTLAYFGQSNHRATLNRSGNTSYIANIQSSAGGSCVMSCIRTGP